MQRKLTITIDPEVYEGLYASIGARQSNHFIENLVRPYVIRADLEVAYSEMAQDEAREAEALEWAEAIIGDLNTGDADEAWNESKQPLKCN